MRASLLVLMLGLAALTAVASPALADITITHLPVYACVSAGTCTPCLDPIVIQEGVVDFSLTGADCP